MTDSLREILDFLKSEKWNASFDGQLYRQQMFEKLEDMLLEMGEREADRVARVEFLLKTFNLYGPDGSFTFPDGETWDLDPVENWLR